MDSTRVRMGWSFERTESSNGGSSLWVQISSGSRFGARSCCHEIFPQTAKHPIWTAAINEDKFLQYLVATPLQRFRCKNAFSTNLLILYAFLSYFRWIFRFFRGGITTFISKFSALLTILLLSYARSAINPRAPVFSISSSAFAQSAVTPSVTTHRTGTPRAQKCFLDSSFCILFQRYAEKS